MLSNTLVTNEIKDRSGAEVEFERISVNDETTTFKQVAEDIANPNRLAIKHQTNGTGPDRVRRSLVRFDKTITTSVGKKATVSAYCTVVIPVGVLENTNAVKDAVAQLLSFMATTGSGTAVLFDGSGNGASVIINETL